MMRRALVLLAVMMAMIPAMSVSALSEEPWEFEGGGWGHGVGLSQYGSEGMALDGYPVDEIIDFYYSGAVIKSKDAVGAPAWLDGEDAIWVGLSSSQTTKTFQAIGDGIEVCQTGDGTDTCDTPADETLTNGQVLTVAIVEASSPVRCTRSVDGGPVTEGDCWIDISWPESPGSTGVLTGSQKYERGSVHVRPGNHDPNNASTFHVAVSVSLEHYVYGIAETLLQWEPAALETQAVIARSYGVRKAIDRANGDGSLTDSRKDTCWCHLSASPVDQNYDGWDIDNEGSATYGDKWRLAVDDTQGQIVTHPSVGGGNSIIATYYSSSNGGASENVEDVWGGSPSPYLKSVQDHWSADPAINPLADWTVLVTDKDMATALGWDIVLDAFHIQGPPGVLVRFTGYDNGDPVETVWNGTQLRSLLNTYGYLDGGGSVRVSPYITLITDPPGFDDIIGNTFEADIDWLAGAGVTKGCNPPDNTLFCPDDAVSREVMAAFLNRYLDLAPASKDYFTDDEGSIFEDDINRVAEAGITRGCNPPDNDHFCPKRSVDRGQMAAFLVRALGLTDNGGGDLFTDDNSSVFENDIDKLGTAGITRGCNPPKNDHFCPIGIVNRAQMAAFLHRADDL